MTRKVSLIKLVKAVGREWRLGEAGTNWNYSLVSSISGQDRQQRHVRSSRRTTGEVTLGAK
jgi:hypothetical protein